MPVYVYETTDPAKPPRRFEIRQSMKDKPLRTDPATGEPVRRVISGGFGVMKSGTPSAPATRGGSCGPSCGCH
jgi:predicted nucleic acid-binding Zn ribbon protein